MAAVAPRATTPRTGALAGLRVVELGFAAAGPWVGKHLANHGAEVIKVESRAALDAFRTTYPPFKDNVEGVDRAAMFAFFNDGKRGITLDLKSEHGLSVLKRLVRRSDVLIESFPAGTLAKRGITYDALSRDNPGLVMLSSCNQGQTGPHAAHPGYGSQLTALAGFLHLLGEPDRTPVLIYGPYIDYIAVGYGVIALLAALARRRRTNQGCNIDLSQLEAGVQFMTPALLEHQSTGRIPTRVGNRDLVALPHGVYPCAPTGNKTERWVAFSVWSDDEWARFTRATDHADWTRGDPQLEERISDWTRVRDRDAVVALLREAGLRAAPVLTMGELFTDPQLRHRKAWVELEHPVLSMHGLSAPWTLSATPQQLTTAGPPLGADNDYVYGELLGMSADERARLEAAGTFR
ncbi:MAG: CoA transferase [Chloroflexi bacterium]|nr:CoA transferase [Chloroflexota bacterium]